MLNDKELQLVIMELETESISPEVYRYRTEYGLTVVCYMFDIQKLESFIFEPIYLYTDDVECLLECTGKTEKELFQIILGNTVAVMQTKIIPYSVYLKGFEGRCSDRVRLELIKRIIDVMEETEEESRLWCVTNTIEERGATGCFHIPLLRSFCEEHSFQRLLIGVSNNDFAFLCSAGKEEMVHNMQVLVYEISHVIQNEDKTVQRAVLEYDYEENELRTWQGNRNR